MRRAALIFLAVCSMTALAHAGPEQYSGKDKEMLEPAPPPCERFNGHEWDISIWGAYAFPANTGRFHNFPSSAENFDEDRPFDDLPVVFDVGPVSRDRILNRNHTWGGGADIKYFWTRYVGFGLEGFVLTARETVGAGLGTLTLRYPIGCSRFAPYAFAGLGVIGGGSHLEKFYVSSGETPGGQEEAEFEFFDDRVIHEDANVIGQFGAGLEIRVSRHIGLMGDFTWNVVDEPNNNFGMARGGLTFSF